MKNIDTYISSFEPMEVRTINVIFEVSRVQKQVNEETDHRQNHDKLE